MQGQSVYRKISPKAGQRLCGHQTLRTKRVFSFRDIKGKQRCVARIHASVGWENSRGDSNVSNWRFKFRGGQSPVFPKTSKLNADQRPRLLVKDVTHHYMWSQCPRKPLGHHKRLSAQTLRPQHVTKHR